VKKKLTIIQKNAVADFSEDSGHRYENNGDETIIRKSPEAGGSNNTGHRPVKQGENYEQKSPERA